MDVCLSCLRIAVCLLVAQWSPSSAAFSTENPPVSGKAHSRQKRILWVTSDGRLALPPGTTLIVTPSLSLPFVRYPPDGFFSNITISLPFTIDFNKLGLTDNENPFGILPPGFARSMGRATAGLLGDYVAKIFRHRRLRRSAPMDPPPPGASDAFHGGERALLYTVVEDFLTNFGMDGKACLLRAICEVHAHPLTNFGLIGEMLKLFFSASKSPYSEILSEYVAAERAGSGSDSEGHGECWPYLKDCPKSLFEPRPSPYTAPVAQDEQRPGFSNEVDDEDRRTEVTYQPPINIM